MKLSKLFGVAVLAGMLAGCNHSAHHSVYFDSGSDKLSYSSKQKIKKIATMVKEKEEASQILSADTRIRLSGFSDNVGKHKHNKKLAKKRIKAVNQELVKNGVNPWDIRYVAKGESWLLDKEGKESRKMRRVDINIYK